MGALKDDEALAQLWTGHLAPCLPLQPPLWVLVGLPQFPCHSMGEHPHSHPGLDAPLSAARKVAS